MKEKEICDIACDIFNNVFSSKSSYLSFRYKHYRNPYKLTSLLFIEKVENDIAGINFFLAAKCICESQELYVAQSCDSAVLEQYRGKGIFTSIIQNAQKELQSQGVDFLFGFPNSNSYPGFIKLGWRHEADFCRFFLPIDLYASLKYKIGKKCARIVHSLLNKIILFRINRLAKKTFHGTISTHDRCPFVKKDFDIINNCNKIMIKRSTDYYIWKLDENPTKDFKYIVAKEKDRLYGFIVYYVRDEEINIVDWFYIPNNNELILMAKLIKQLFNINKGKKINFLLINTKSKEVQLMKRLGFWNASNKILKHKPSLLVVYCINSALESKLHAPENWLLRYIDTDTILNEV
jgi:hypothetical protein